MRLRRGCTRYISGIAALAVLFTVGVPAGAFGAAAPSTTAVPAQDLGGVSQIRIPGDGLVQRVTAQVPNGLKPVAIQADWQRTPEITSGALTVEQDGVSIASSEVGSAPLVAEGTTINLKNPSVVNNTFTFDLRVRPSGDRAVCSPLLETGAVTLSNMQLTFTGDDTPSTISDFLPVALQRLVIALPDKPTSAQSQAAFEISNLAVRSYGLDPAHIQVVPLGQNPQVGELERTVVIGGNSPDGISVDGRILSIGGSDPIITKNVVALSTAASTLSQTPKAVIDKATQTAIPDRERYSFADLNIPSIDLDGIGRVERTISLSQANVGGPAHNWNVRVVGAYEPQRDNSDATFSIMTNGTLLRSVLLDKSGLLDLSVHIPDELAGRNPSLTFRFDTTPADASCTAANPFSASISSKSSIDIERGSGSTSQGFTRWPQVALPRLNVAFDNVTVDAIAAAVNTVASLQKTTTTPIAVNVADSLKSDTQTPLLAVVTSGTVPDYLDAPLPGPGVRLIGDKDEELVTLTSDEKLSSLQAYEHNGNNLLVLAGPSANDIRSLSNTLVDQKDGWFALRGDTWFRAGGHAPSSLQARGGALRVEPIAPATSTVLERHRALFIIGAVVIVVALLGLLYPRMVQDRPTSGAHSAGGRRSTDSPPSTEDQTTEQ